MAVLSKISMKSFEIDYNNGTGITKTDGAFANVSGVEKLKINDNDGDAVDFTLGTNAQAAGITDVVLVKTSATATVDASNYTTGIKIVGATGTGLNTLTGGSANDTLSGGAKTDDLTGNAGDDTFMFASGNFEGTGGTDTDTIAGGKGTMDTIQITSNSEIIVDTDFASVTGVEKLLFDNNTGTATADFAKNQAVTLGSKANTAVTSNTAADALIIDASDVAENKTFALTVTSSFTSKLEVTGAAGDDVFKIDAAIFDTDMTLAAGGQSNTDTLTITDTIVNFK